MTQTAFRSGFVNIFGRPNAGKSTLLNALVGEKLAITSPKVQTTRHRIMGILHTDKYQIIFSDTPGIIDPEYKLHQRMMSQVTTALEDADLAILMVDAKDDVQKNVTLFQSLKLKTTRLLVINKCDLVDKKALAALEEQYKAAGITDHILSISALKKINTDTLLQTITNLLPEAPPYYPEDMLTDKPMRFFVSELIREKIYDLFRDEIPYHTTVLITEYKEKLTLTKISASIVVQRESQKAIILGNKGEMIKKLGSLSRQAIEAFIDQKVFLELHIKVRPKWRDNETFLREYGYQ